MSAAKMVADSTQGDLLETSSVKKRKRMAQTKKGKKKKEKESDKKRKKSQEEEFDDSDLDLEKDVHPISYYVKDRENLLEQMFHCVKGHSLKRALPEVLKELPLDELKRRCMEQLEVMSKKRIRRILAGDDPASISSSGTEDETSEEELLEIEEGEVDQQSTDGLYVDSTSPHSTPEVEDSERELVYEEGSMGLESPSPVDEEDPGSVVHDSQSPYTSDEEQNDHGEYEERSDDGEDVVMEEVAIKKEETTTHIEPEKTAKRPRTPEEPEEGEVIDDEEYQIQSTAPKERLTQEGDATLENKEIVEESLQATGNEKEVLEKKVTNAVDDGNQVGDDKKNKTAVENPDISEEAEKSTANEDIVTDNVENTDTSNTSADENSKKSEDTVETEPTPAASGSDSNSSTEIEREQNVSDTRLVKAKDETVEIVGQTVQEVEDTAEIEDAIEVDDDLVIDEEAESIEIQNYDTKSSEKMSRHKREREDLESEVDKKHIEKKVSDLAGTSKSNVRTVMKPGVGDMKKTKQSKSVLHVHTMTGKKTKEGSAEIVSDAEKGKQPHRIVKPPKQDIAPALTKNQMELLELEMRARAIKAMLKTAK